MIQRYSPNFKEVYTGIGSFYEAFMEKDEGGYYVNRLDLLSKLATMRENACDPAETDTLNTIIKLLEK
jgi:hypothetical protein